nr:MAG TPA: hypothetical protein [Caudoviricetes sp.]
MNDLQIFNNEEFGEVRTAVINDEPMYYTTERRKHERFTNFQQ